MKLNSLRKYRSAFQIKKKTQHRISNIDYFHYFEKDGAPGAGSATTDHVYSYFFSSQYFIIIIVYLGSDQTLRHIKM